MIVVKTNVLKEMMGKAIKGVTNNKLLPLTSLIGIFCDDKKGLMLRTFDGYNSLVVSNGDITTKDSFYVVVYATAFNNLINKTTTETITLENKDKYLYVKGNGNYKFDIAIDNNSVVEFPMIVDNEASTEIKVNLKDFKLALDNNKQSAATTFDEPSLTGAYFGDMLLTTNSYLATLTKINLFGDTPILLSYTTLNLLNALDGEVVNVKFYDDKIKIYDDTVEIYGSVMPEIEDYPFEQVMSFCDIDFANKIVVDKNELLSILNRINLFINIYDNNAIHLNFDGKNLKITTINGSGEETLNCSIEKTDKIDYFNAINYSLFKTQVQTIKGDKATICFGNSVHAVTISDDISTHLVALIRETE